MTAPHGGGSLETQERPEVPPATSHTKVRVAIAAAVVVAIVAVVLVSLLVSGSKPAADNGLSRIVPQAPGLAQAPPIQPVAPMAFSNPLRISMPSIGANSTLVPVGTDAQNHMQVPPVSQPQQAAWYSKAPTPGSLGPSVVLGHVNGDGREGVFANLAKAKAGDQVSVDRADGQTAVFTVYNVTTVDKDKFPTDQVYGNTSDPQIRLITCGGDLDRAAHNYLSNVVVYGVLTGIHKT